MAFQPAFDVIKLEAIWTIHGQRCMNRFHVKNTSPMTPALLEQAVMKLESSLRFAVRQEMSQEAECVLLRATDIARIDGIQLERPPVTPLIGTDVSQSLPNNVTIAVTWRTAHGGRNGRGRTYHIGLTAAMVEDSHMTPTNLAQVLAAYDTLMDNFNADGFTFVVVSRSHLGAVMTNAEAYPIISVSVDSTLDSQRRRLPGRGS